LERPVAVRLYFKLENQCYYYFTFFTESDVTSVESTLHTMFSTLLSFKVFFLLSLSAPSFFLFNEKRKYVHPKNYNGMHHQKRWLKSWDVEETQERRLFIINNLLENGRIWK